MLALRVEISRHVDDAQPGWVECRLVDSAGREHRFVEKLPVVTAEGLGPDSDDPQPGAIACALIERRTGAAGREVIVVDTEAPWGVASTTGAHRFEVFSEQLQDL